MSHILKDLRGKFAVASPSTTQRATRKSHNILLSSFNSQLRATFKPLNMKRPDLKSGRHRLVTITYDYIDYISHHVDIIALQGHVKR